MGSDSSRGSVWCDKCLSKWIARLIFQCGFFVSSPECTGGCCILNQAKRLDQSTLQVVRVSNAYEKFPARSELSSSEDSDCGLPPSWTMPAALITDRVSGTRSKSRRLLLYMSTVRRYILLVAPRWMDFPALMRLKP